MSVSSGLNAMAHAVEGLYAPDAEYGQSLVLKIQPLGGLSRWGAESSGVRPCQSVAGSLPSTGRV